MKKIFTQMTSYLVSASLIFAPLMSQAGQKTRGSIRPVPKKFREDFVNTRSYLNSLGYTMRWDRENNRGLVYDSNNNNELVMEVPFESKETLRKYSPSNVEGRLLKEMAKINATVQMGKEQPLETTKALGKYAGKAAWNGVKAIPNTTLGRSTRAAWSHAIHRLPVESAMFFMAMGAVAAGQLFLDYSQNPVALKQHLEHQLSPLGVIGFWSFMFTQGVASNMMMTYFGNQKLAAYTIPYLGMTAGFFVQSYLSQIMADPNVVACGKEMVGMKATARDIEHGVVEKPCDAAYESIVVNGKISNLMPGLASMIVSTALSGALQAGAKRAAFKLGWMELAILLTPGQTQIKGLRMIVAHGLQIYTFVALDAAMNRWITKMWKNKFDGNALASVNTAIVDQINDLKASNWEGDDSDLQFQIKDFKERMVDWRMMNMSAVFEAHQNWSESISNMTGDYNAAQSFYKDFSDEIRNSRYDITPGNKPLEMILPLKGVIAKGLPADKKEQYFTFPKFIEQQQVDTVKDAYNYLAVKLLNEKMDVTADQKAKLLKLQASLDAGLKSYSQARGYFIGRSLYEFNQLRYWAATSDRSPNRTFNNILDDMYTIMGKPDPMLAPGRGFVTTYAESEEKMAELEGADFEHDGNHRVGQFYAPTVTDKMVMEMICGPDVTKDEMLTKDKWGFPSKFTAPRLVYGSFDALCAQQYGTKLQYADTFYTMEIPGIKGKKYRGFIEYLIDNSINDAIGTKEASGMDAWWKANTEPQMRRAFNEYGKAYNEIVANMLDGLFTNERTPWGNLMSGAVLNSGPIANGVVASIQQQQNIYYRILSELMNPVHGRFTLDFAAKPTRVRMHPAFMKIQEEFDKLVTMIQRIKVIEKGAAPTYIPNLLSAINAPDAASFEKNMAMLDAGSRVDYIRIESDLENFQIDEQVKNVKAAITNAAKYLGVASAPVPAAAAAAPSIEDALADFAAEDGGAEVPAAPKQEEIKAVVTLNKKQAQVAQQVLEGLDMLSQDFSTYARIANAVTWDKIQNTKLIDEENNKFNNNIQKKMKTFRMTNPGG